MTKAIQRAANFLSQDAQFEAFQAGRFYDIFNLSTGESIRVHTDNLNQALSLAGDSVEISIN